MRAFLSSPMSWLHALPGFKPSAGMLKSMHQRILQIESFVVPSESDFIE